MKKISGKIFFSGYFNTLFISIYFFYAELLRFRTAGRVCLNNWRWRTGANWRI